MKGAPLATLGVPLEIKGLPGSVWGQLPQCKTYDCVRSYLHQIIQLQTAAEREAGATKLFSTARTKLGRGSCSFTFDKPFSVNLIQLPAELELR